MKFLQQISRYQILIISLSFFVISCKNNSIKVISFDANIVKPGRAEQNKFTSYSLKIISNEKTIVANSIKILFNNDIEITPIQFKLNTNSVYNLGDTIHCSFSTQNEINSNDFYKLIYHNNKKTKQKKLNYPQLINNTNIPKL